MFLDYDVVDLKVQNTRAQHTLGAIQWHIQPPNPVLEVSDTFPKSLIYFTQPVADVILELSKLLM